MVRECVTYLHNITKVTSKFALYPFNHTTRLSLASALVECGESNMSKPVNKNLIPGTPQLIIITRTKNNNKNNKNSDNNNDNNNNNK